MWLWFHNSCVIEWNREGRVRLRPHQQFKVALACVWYEITITWLFFVSTIVFLVDVENAGGLSDRDSRGRCHIPENDMFYRRGLNKSNPDFCTMVSTYGKAVNISVTLLTVNAEEFTVSC